MEATTSTPKTAETKGTKYVVLRYNGGEAHWTEVGALIATSADAALRNSVKDQAGTYVAVPYRSWKPVKVTVSTETVVKLG